MFELTAYLNGLYAILVMMVLAWLLSIKLNNVSIVDSLWSLAFLLAAMVYALTLTEAGPRTALVLVLVTIWALRLAAYITWRNWGEGEDRRYQAMRANNQPHFQYKSLYIVFGLQGILAWVISLPLLAAMAGPTPLGGLDLLAVMLWLVGFTFEAGGDWQLQRFKADPNNAGKVMDQGLWRYTRHPNYFGDFCIWWSFYLFALAAGGWWAIIAPLLMSFFLLKVSGVALLEKDIAERRPKYADYIRRTNAFFPGPPKA
jgi:steroid 5-alpha reductase family enzyme